MPVDYIGWMFESLQPPSDALVTPYLFGFDESPTSSKCILIRILYFFSDTSLWALLYTIRIITVFKRLRRVRERDREPLDIATPLEMGTIYRYQIQFLCLLMPVFLSALKSIMRAAIIYCIHCCGEDRLLNHTHSSGVCKVCVCVAIERYLSQQAKSNTRRIIVSLVLYRFYIARIGILYYYTTILPSS